MPVPKVSVPVRPVRRAFAQIAISALTVLLCSAAWAQQPPAPAPKAAPQPKAPAPAPKAAPKQQPAPQAAPQPQPQQQQAGGNLSVIYTPWAKVCGQNDQPGAARTCLTMIEAHLETGQFLAGAMFVEPEGQTKKLMRITLHLGMQIPQGTRVILDQEPPLSGRYVACLPNGCISDYEIDADFLAKLKKGQNIVLQGINLNNQTASYQLPLADFAKTIEGAGADPKQFEANVRKQQEDLQKRAEQARQRMQQQGGAQAPSR